MPQLGWMMLLILLAGCSSPPMKPPTAVRGDFAYTERYVTWLIEQEMRSAGITGMSVALVDDQSVVWARGFGYADKQAGVKATADTVYHLGSIAKVFTSTAAMQLQDEGKLDIDRPLQTYLPRFGIKSRFGDIAGITPRNIMTHHSGLPGYWIRGMTERHPARFEEQVTAVRNEYVATPPNTVFAYSNLGMSLLGTVVGELGEGGYADYMNRFILQPLGMDHSEFAPRIVGKAYRNGVEVEAVPMRDLPSSSLSSSARDMAHFIQMVFAEGQYNGKQIIRPEALREMFRVQNAHVPYDFDFRIGLGWILSGINVPGGGTVASHGGTTLNYHTMLAVMPEHKLGVVVLSNSARSENSVAKITTALLQHALEAKHGIPPPTETPFVEPVLVPLGENDLRDYSGYFETLLGLVKVEARRGELYAEQMGMNFTLVKHAEGDFGVRWKPLGLFALATPEMKSIRLSMQRMGGREVLTFERDGFTQLLGEKLHPQPLPRYLDEYVGAYDFVNPHDGPMPENVRVVREGDLLIGEFGSSIMPHIMLRSPVLRTAFLPGPVEGELIMAGLGSSKGETIRLAKVDGVPHMYYAGFELVKRSATSR